MHAPQVRNTKAFGLFWSDMCWLGGPIALSWCV